VEEGTEARTKRADQVLRREIKALAAILKVMAPEDKEDIMIKATSTAALNHLLADKSK